MKPHRTLIVIVLLLAVAASLAAGGATGRYPSPYVDDWAHVVSATADLRGGVNDADAAIAACLAASGKAIFREGTYRITPATAQAIDLTLLDGAIVEGAGMGKTILRMDDNDTGAAILLGNNCTIRRLTIDAFDDASTLGARLASTKDGALYEEVEFSDLSTGCQDGGDAATGIRLVRCKFTSCAIGFRTNFASPDVDLVGCTFSANTTNLSITAGTTFLTRLTPRDFGAVGDGVADDTTPLQEYINAHFNSEVVLTPGTYRTTNSLKLQSPTGAQGNISLRTDLGRGWDRGSVVPKGSVKILADHKEGPAIVIQGCLNARISGIEIEGLNTAPPDDSSLPKDFSDKEVDWVSGVSVSSAVDEGSTWLITTSSDHGLTTGKDAVVVGMTGLTPSKYTAQAISVVNATQFRINADPFTGTYTSGGKATQVLCDQHNPYAGIAIDPYTGTKPTGGYDNDSYGKPISRWVWIEDVVIRKFVVGIAGCPSDTTLNCDGVSIRDSLINRCMYGITTGHSNNKGWLIEGVDINTCMTAVDGVTFGKQTGYPPQIVGGSIYRCFYMFNVPLGNGHFSCHGLYSEHNQAIGHLGKSVTINRSAGFYGCVFDFYNYSGDLVDPNDPPLHLVTYGPVHFSGCDIYLAQGTFNVGGLSDNDVTFDNTVFLHPGNDWADIPYIGLSITGKPRVRLNGCAAYMLPAYVPSLTPFEGLNTQLRRGAGALPTRLDLAATARELETADGTFQIQRNPDALDTGPYVITLSANTPSWTNNEMSVVIPSPERVLVGDVLAWRTIARPLASNSTYDLPLVQVTGINGSTVTGIALCDHTQIDKTFNPGVLYIVYRPYVHGEPVFGDTNSTTTVSNISSATAKFKVGDFINGAGIPLKTRVTAVGATTVTLSNAATATATGVYLYSERLRTPDGVVLDSAAPTKGRWTKGAIVRNVNYSGTGTREWQNIATGTPGTWIAISGTATKTYDPPSLAAGASDTTSITGLSGLAVGMTATATHAPDLPNGFMLFAQVVSSSQIDVTLANVGGATTDVASGTLTVRWWQ